MPSNVIPRTLARSSFRSREYLPFGGKSAAQEYALQRLVGLGEKLREGGGGERKTEK
jgi:hypothetical protein